jgi:RNA polymerase sigma-70 factor (ECF subfamily)
MNPAADPEYLGSLLRELGGALALYAAQWTDAAEDCVQEALLELVRQPEIPRNVPGWLFRVVRNRAISRARAAQRRHKHETRAGEERPLLIHPSREPEWSAAEVTAAVEQLDGDLREVVVLRIWGGLNFESIAETASIGTTTAHRRYEAGLKALRRILGIGGRESGISGQESGVRFSG